MKAKEILQDKRLHNIILIVFMLLLVAGGSYIRTQGLPLLKDSTTGEYIPLALDPYYFMRLAEAVQDDGTLPEFDTMRASGGDIPFVDEILPHAIFFMHKAATTFDSSISLEFVTIISTVIFFALGIVAFFFLILALTNSKLTAAISCFLLTIIPPYLYRTLAGFADHEAIGMLAFFLAILCYVLALKALRRDTNKTMLYGLLVGFVSALTILSWGGIANFVFLIIPLSFAVIWLTRPATSNLSEYLIFYLTWFSSSIAFSVLLGYSFNSIIARFILSGSGIMGPFLFMFLIVDYLLIEKVKNIKKYKARAFISGLIVIIISSILLAFVNKSIVPIVIEVLGRLLNPAGLSRIGNTVAENQAPYLTTITGQIGNLFFSIFCAGCALFGFVLSRGVKGGKERALFFLSWVFMVASILFSRVSVASVLDGETFISKVFYFLGIILFVGYSCFLYLKRKLTLKEEMIVVAAWLFVSLVAARGSVRFLFVIIPLFCFVTANLLPNLFYYARKSKDDLIKMLTWITLILFTIGLVISSIAFFGISYNQAKYTPPSMNLQWQEAMEWTRDNTQQGEVFVHWWDYGYWVQTVGERPTVTDGGHAYGYWDHLIARYLLTTPYPHTALSFMKTHDVSYLLIDPSDVGKYPAYSKIGSGPDGEDRFSWIPSYTIDLQRTIETSNSTITFYQGGSLIDEDIIYEGKLLPSGHAGLWGISLEIGDDSNIKGLAGAFVYNNERYDIPIRYLSYNNKIIDFGKGINSMVNLIPLVNQGAGGSINVNNVGSAMYFSEKTVNSLFVQKYLLNNTGGPYGNLKLVYSGSDSIVKSLNNQGANLGEFVFFGGIRGPIKIWEVSYPENVEVKEKYLSTSGEFAEHDE